MRSLCGGRSKSVACFDDAYPEDRLAFAVNMPIAGPVSASMAVNTVWNGPLARSQASGAAQIGTRT